MDYSKDGTDENRYTKQEIENLKNSPYGRKLVLSYLSIGEAETYRWYWNPNWDKNNDGIPDSDAPEWLGPANPQWLDNYKVKYWYPQWQQIIFEYLDKIIEAGFDGVYLDIVDAYEYWGPGGESGLNRSTAEREMVEFVKSIAQYARITKGKQNFGVFPQNAEGLSVHQDYVETVNGIGKEDLWYNDNTPTNWADWSIQHLDRFQKAGKLVLVIDYITRQDLIDDFYSKALKKGYIPYVSNRALDRITVVPKLIWNDEFNYEGSPDSYKWDYDIGGHGWGNNELQYYTDRLENVRVDNGHLIIEAKKESYEGNNYTSARLVSRGKGDWLYGRFEIRAKLPTGRGVWPAIWMLPTDNIYGVWPNSGEIDIMECVGFEPARVHSTVHTANYNHLLGTQKGGSLVLNPPPQEVFYTYICEWTPQKIDFYVKRDTGDMLKVFSFNKESDDYKVWPFNQKFHLILNIAVGGSWGGLYGVDDSIFPQKMEIDYVRVYSFTEEIVRLNTIINPPQAADVEKIPDQELYIASTKVVVVAKPKEGWRFKSWSGDVKSFKNPLLINLDSHKTIIANFELTESYNKKDLILVTNNSDNKNDVIIWEDDLEIIKIYDSKGKLIFEGDPKTFNQKILKTGFYIYEAKYKNGKVKKSKITVLK